MIREIQIGKTKIDIAQVFDLEEALDLNTNLRTGIVRYIGAHENMHYFKVGRHHRKYIVVQNEVYFRIGSPREGAEVAVTLISYHTQKFKERWTQQNV